MAGALTTGVSSYAQVATLRQELGLDSARNPLALMVVQPSFTPAYALWVERASSTDYRLHYQSTQQPPAAPHSSPAARVRRRLALDPAVAQSLIDVVAAALAQTRYDNSRTMRGDGTTYAFINFEPGIGWQSGSTWSPSPPTAMGQLAELVEDLHRAATSTDSRTIHQELVRMQARSLLLRLASH